MPVTGIYFIPATPSTRSTLDAAVERLAGAYHPAPVGRWALEHRLMRDTASCLPPSALSGMSGLPGLRRTAGTAGTALPDLAPRFMHFLSMSHYSGRGFVYISERPGAAAAASARRQSEQNQQPKKHQQQQQQQQQSSPHPQPSHPPPQQQQQPPSPPHHLIPMTMLPLDVPSLAALHIITVRACEALWCPRHTVSITGGLVFDLPAADVRVRIGDVRQVQPMTRPRGTVVEIEYRGPNAAVPAVGGSDEDGNGVWGEDEGVPDINEDVVLIPDDGGGRGPMTALVPESEDDWEMGETIIREVWSRIALDGAREYIRVPDVGKEAQLFREKGSGVEGWNRFVGVDLARQYMEIFRFHR